MLRGGSHNVLSLAVATSMKLLAIRNLLTLFSRVRDALGHGGDLEPTCKAKDSGDARIDYRRFPGFQKKEFETNGPAESSGDRRQQPHHEGPEFTDCGPPPQKDRTTDVEFEGPWAGLVDEVLAQIFDRLPFEDRWRTVPLVCKDWREVGRSPSSWRNVDMDPWMKAKADEDCDWEAEVDMTRIVRAVVDLSGWQLQQLRTGYCSTESVDYIAENCPQLRDLSIRNSFLVDDEAAMNLARKCRRLENLDLSDCYNLSAKSLELFGMNCPLLKCFARNMIDILHYDEVVAPRGDEEAAAVARYMVGLKQLEMRRMESLTDSGLLSIARSCPQLEKLDLACCSAITAQALDNVVNLCRKLTSFVRPIKARMHVADPKYYVPGLYMVSY